MAVYIPANREFWRKLYSLERRFRKHRHGRRRTSGVELEGAFNPSDGNVHCDTSVSVSGIDIRDAEDGCCNGDCRGNCECASYCDCTACQRCESCNSPTDECSCEDCMMCGNCGEQWESCCCVPIAHESSDCVDILADSWGERDHVVECFEGHCCEACVVYMLDHRDIEYNCFEHENTYNGCQLDGSDCGCSCECECDCLESSGGLADGEKVSPPTSMFGMCEWIHENYPVQINASCGGHNHKGGYSALEYSWLMSEAFNNYLMNSLERWGHAMSINEGSSFWVRLLQGKSLIAKRFQPYLQVDLSSKDQERYCQLNYCWSLHETLELRLLPMFQKEELYIKLVLAVDGMIESYLAGMRERHVGDWHIMPLRTQAIEC